MNTTELLEASLATLSDPARWTKGTVGRDRNGKAVDCAWDPSAVCYCLSGALWMNAYHAIPGTMEREASDRRVLVYGAMGELRRAIAPVSAEWAKLTGTQIEDMEAIADFNDHDLTEHHHVIDVLDKAIASSRAH